MVSFENNIEQPFYNEDNSNVLNVFFLSSWSLSSATSRRGAS